MPASELETKQQILDCERKLLNAFTAKDIATLDALIHEDALFVLPNGFSITKAKVLDNYRSGNTSMGSIISSDEEINFIGDTAIISTNLELKGKSHDKKISANFRYIRVWKLFEGQWQVIATGGVGK